MVQIENEYGSYGNDRNYMKRLRDVWTTLGVDVPFFTGDGPTPFMLEAGSLPGAAVGLDSGSNEKHWELARSIVPGVPVFSSETYPGWLTHWGEQWQTPSVPNLIKEVTFLLTNRKSFNFYVAHGGTNFGFTAGANSGGKGGYEPDVTSYDYDAPIGEQGNATPKYHALRNLMASHLPAGVTLPPIPNPIPAMAVPEFAMTPLTSALGPTAETHCDGASEILRGLRSEPGPGAVPHDACGTKERTAARDGPARLRDGVRGRQVRRHDRSTTR